MSPEPPAAPATPHILRRPVTAVVFWDFDGTVYRAPAGCRRYGEEIARWLAPGQRGEYLASLDQYLSGQGGIHAADGWEAAVELAARYLVAGDGVGSTAGDGVRSTAGEGPSDEDRPSDVPPPAGPPAGPSALSPSRFHEEFRRAREYMESGECPLEVPRGLPEAIARMRPISRHILLTNTPAFGVYRLLHRLGIAQCFDEVVCEAAKPTLLPARLAAAASVYGLQMPSVLCVGDHFDNDVAPALAARAAGAYVNAYGAGPAGAADFEGPVLEAILSDIERWVSTAGARRSAETRAPVPSGGKEQT